MISGEAVARKHSRFPAEIRFVKINSTREPSLTSGATMNGAIMQRILLAICSMLVLAIDPATATTVTFTGVIAQDVTGSPSPSSAIINFLKGDGFTAIFEMDLALGTITGVTGSQPNGFSSQTILVGSGTGQSIFASDPSTFFISTRDANSTHQTTFTFLPSPNATNLVGLASYQLIAFKLLELNDIYTGHFVGYDSVSTTTTPLPAALPLFASGLGLMGLLGWRRKRKAQAVA